MGISTAWGGYGGIQIISDGEKLYIILPGEGGGALCVEQALFTQFMVNSCAGGQLEKTIFGDHYHIFQRGGPSYVEGSLNFRSSGKVKWIKEGPGLFDLNFFRNATVRELFKAINKKLDGRK